MYTIIQRSIPKYRITCPDCNSIFEFESEDIKCDGEEIFGDYHTSTTIKCPVCHNVIVLSVDSERLINYERVN